MSNASDFIIKDGVLRKYVGPCGDVVIPEGVHTIHSDVFCENDTITALTLPASVKNLMYYEFYCSK